MLNLETLFHYDTRKDFREVHQLTKGCDDDQNRVEDDANGIPRLTNTAVLQIQFVQVFVIRGVIVGLIAGHDERKVARLKKRKLLSY